MSVPYIDTHVAVFLYAGAVEELGMEAKQQIQANDFLLNVPFEVALCRFPPLHSHR